MTRAQPMQASVRATAITHQRSATPVRHVDVPAQKSDVAPGVRAAFGGPSGERWLVWAALAVVYVVWGSTFLAMRWVVTELPALGMSGARGLVAGSVLYLVLRARGMAPPTRRQWLSSATVGLFFLPIANGSVALAERSISSGFASVGVAASPLFAALLAWSLGERPRSREALGLLLGFAGIGCLCLGTEQHGARLGALLVMLVSPLGSAIGALASKKMPQPPALMAASAQLLTGGTMLLVLSTLTGERWPAPAAVHGGVWAAFAYLVVFGSIVGYGAYAYLLQKTRLSVAMSCSYVNPIIAVLLGASVGHESVRSTLIMALLLVAAGVAFIVTDRTSSAGAKGRPSEPDGPVSGEPSVGWSEAATVPLPPDAERD